MCKLLITKNVQFYLIFISWISLGFWIRKLS
jgi:hypothetical protein